MRTLLVALFLLLGLLQGETKKFVVDLTTGDLATFESRFLSGVPGSIRHFLSKGDTVHVAVVVHGNAYKFFIADLEETSYWQEESLSDAQEQLKASLDKMLKDYDITIEMCSVGMQKRQILSDTLYPFVTPIPTAMSGLIRWQNNGYAYIPIN